jgi:2-oxoisovalerate dehydrogenase E1 component alpha subunit
VLPYYRDMGVALAWGIPLLDVFLATFARADDPMSGGRQIPNHWSDEKGHIFTQSSPIGTQYPHAVGIAHGLGRRATTGVVVVYGGEGSTSEGDWHEAMNWAGDPPPPCHLRDREQPLRHLGAERRGGGRVDRRSGRGYDIAGRSSTATTP